MVGVPGRSKACNTCKKRRIACTFERPQCAQCIKSNRVCTGYHRERIFVQNQERVEDSLKASKRASCGEVTYNKASTREKCDVPLVIRSRDVPGSSSSSHYSQMALVKDIHPSFVFQQQLLSEFLFNWIPGSDKAIEQRKSDKQDSWLMMLPGLPSFTKALETSILAVCTANLGRLHNAPVLVKESSRLYGQGLWELQKALWDPQLMYKDETLAACIALSMYEIIECPGGTHCGWLTHSDGCSRLVRLRGPKAHCQTSLAHQLFRSSRYTTLIQKATQRNFTYLADPEWRELAWNGFPKNLLDKLLDAFAEGVNIMAQADQLASLGGADLMTSVLTIANRCWEVDAQMQEIYRELETNTLGPLYWPEFSTLDNPADDSELGKVFPVAFHFLNLRMAGTCVLYWALCIMLWSGLRSLYSVIAMAGLQNVYIATATSDDDSSKGSSPEPSDSKRLPPLEHRADTTELIWNICQSFEFCMQDEMRSMGPSTVLFPLQIALGELKARPQSSRELSWAAAALEMIYERGFRILKSEIHDS